MRATLSFDLGNPDDRREFRIATKATELHGALWEIRENLRQLRKYGAAEEVDPRTVEYIEGMVRDEIGTLMEE